MCGLRGIRVDDPADLGDVWEAALAAESPCVLEAVTDPEVPPLPPHVSLEHARNFALSATKDPARGAMVGRTLRQLFASVGAARR
jgi:pyruvate dehydrogenase (quinone)